MTIDNAARPPVLTFLSWQVAGLALLLSHVGLSLLSGAVAPAYAVTVPLVLLLYAADSMAGFAVFLQFLLYQNLAVSLASGSIDFELYRGLQGTSFALTLGLAAMAWCRLWKATSNRATLTVIAAAMAVVLAYTAIGALRSSPGSAAIYFRSSTIAMLGLLIGWDVGREHGYREVGLCYLTSMALGLVLAVCEVAAPLAYYDAIGAQDYYRLKYGSATINPTLDFRTAQDVLSYLSTSFFNFGGAAYETVRFGGPNMHSVSYAYVMSIGVLVASSLGIYAFAAAVLPLLVLIGVKGAAIMVAATAVLWIAGRRLGGAAMAVFGGAFGTAYIALVIWYGLSLGDYHVLGLMGGIGGFLSNPLGHGIGVGGNLSSSVTSTDLGAGWHDFQLYGADQALESAIGVLLYQMGIGAIAVLSVVWISFRATVGHFRHSFGLIPLAIAVLLANSFFQEEAFSPYALGLLTIFAGVLSSRPREFAAAPQPRYAFA
ncbi:MAG: hypothetical protein ACM30I_08600 [Gemmatimonas sp.]